MISTCYFKTLPTSTLDSFLAHSLCVEIYNLVIVILKTRVRFLKEQLALILE